MPFKILGGVLAVVLLLAYVAPVVVKLREPALTVVALMGLVMMLVDLWQSLKSKTD
jgi:xanthosine utilization system XapX-like protein